MGEYLHKEYEKVEDGIINKHARVDNPKVSVIIPIYNVEQYIRQALVSVVNQTLEEILNNFLLYEISLNNSHFKKYARANKNIRNDFYLRIKCRFKEIAEIISEDVSKKKPCFR